MDQRINRQKLSDSIKHPTKGMIAVYIAAGWSMQRIADTLQLSIDHVRKVGSLPAVRARVDELQRHLVVELALREMGE